MGVHGRTLLVACALAAGTVTAATAADFRFPPEPMVQFPSPVAIPEYSAWYLRGDVAFSFQDDPDISVSGVGAGSSGMDETWGFGAGLGYNFSDRVRGDLTLDYRLETDAEGSFAGGNHETALSSTVGLANLYYDIKGRDRFTPYVGAGLGFSYNQSDDRTIAGLPATGGHGDTSFAAAAMAGFSYRRSDDWLLDVGYRFLYLGDAKTDNSATVGTMNIDGIEAHEIRVGVRFEFQ